MTSVARRVTNRTAGMTSTGLAGSTPGTESEGLEICGPYQAKRASVVLVNLAAVLEKLDEQLLPSLYAAVATSFSATAQELGWITFGRALVQALASPLGGMAGTELLHLQARATSSTH